MLRRLAFFFAPAIGAYGMPKIWWWRGRPVYRSFPGARPLCVRSSV